MTEIELMLHAKEYLDKMAGGIDPISGMPVGESDCLRQERISRCLTYVAGILGRMTGSGGKNGGPGRRVFSLTPEELKKFTVEQVPIAASEIARRINEIAGLDESEGLKAGSIAEFMRRNELIEEKVIDGGRTEKMPTKGGESVGLLSIERTAKSGTAYRLILYGPEAQRFVLDHLDAIVAINTAPSKNSKINKGEPWSADDDKALIEMFNKHVSVNDMAVAFQRTWPGIRARLKRLGLVQGRN